MFAEANEGALKVRADYRRRTRALTKILRRGTTSQLFNWAQSFRAFQFDNRNGAMESGR